MPKTVHRALIHLNEVFTDSSIRVVFERNTHRVELHIEPDVTTERPLSRPYVLQQQERRRRDYTEESGRGCSRGIETLAPAARTTRTTRKRTRSVHATRLLKLLSTLNHEPVPRAKENSIKIKSRRSLHDVVLSRLPTERGKYVARRATNGVGKL